MKLDPPTKADYQAWKANPVTKFYLQAIMEKREHLKEGIAEGQSENVSLDIGRTQSLKDVLDYAIFNFDTVDEDKDD